MSTQHGLLRVFWPLESITPETPGVLVGWQNSALDVFVTAILQGAEPGKVTTAIRLGSLFRNSPHPVHNLTRRCGSGSLQVVGVVNPPDGFVSTDDSALVAYTSSSSIFPRVGSSHWRNVPVQLILFERPHPVKMQYMSLEPIPLALNDRSLNHNAEAEAVDDIELAESKESARLATLVEKMQLHTVVKRRSTHKEMALPTVMNQINCSHELNALLQSNVHLVRGRFKRSLSVGERAAELTSSLFGRVWFAGAGTMSSWLLPLTSSILMHVLMAIRIIAEGILQVVGWHLNGRGVALKDISATAQQVDLRLQQLCYWPIQYMTLRERKGDWKSITNSHSEYIRFYNSLWLVANDVIIGAAVASFIYENANLITANCEYAVRGWSLDGLQQIISWLMVNPGGLKLNDELAKFFGELFLWIIQYWAGCVSTIQPYFPLIVRFIGFSSLAGASMAISLLSDFVSLMTLHTHCFYVASAKIYHWQLTIITSLFHLFRGKKRNVLRNRIDSCDYELDQLLLGTILFTLLSFLLPTVLVFYFTFALTRMVIISIKAVLDTMLAGLNHFPLFALMLRLKDSRRLPGGICFEIRDTPSEFAHDPIKISCIVLKSTPLTLRAIFHEYSRFGNRIRKHYLSPRVLYKFATGGFVPPLHRKNLYGLQYSMLPAQRVPILELWNRMRTTSTSKEASAGATLHKERANGTSQHTENRARC